MLIVFLIFVIPPSVGFAQKADPLIWRFNMGLGAGHLKGHSDAIGALVALDLEFRPHTISARLTSTSSIFRSGVQEIAVLYERRLFSHEWVGVSAGTGASLIDEHEGNRGLGLPLEFTVTTKPSGAFGVFVTGYGNINPGANPFGRVLGLRFGPGPGYE